MNRLERALWLVVNVLLLICGCILVATAQTRCDTLEHDRPILERIISQQQVIIDTRGQTIAVLKIRASLSDSITREVRTEANLRIVRLTQERDQARKKPVPAKPPLLTRIANTTKTVLAVVGAVFVTTRFIPHG